MLIKPNKSHKPNKKKKITRKDFLVVYLTKKQKLTFCQKTLDFYIICDIIYRAFKEKAKNHYKRTRQLVRNFLK